MKLFRFSTTDADYEEWMGFAVLAEDKEAAMNLICKKYDSLHRRAELKPRNLWSCQIIDDFKCEELDLTKVQIVESSNRGA